MAYKRISPMPLVEGGSNASSMSTLDGVIIYDGTRLVTTGAGTSSQLLTSNGIGVAPTFQNSGAGSVVTIMGAGSADNGAGSDYAIGIDSDTTNDSQASLFGHPTAVSNQAGAAAPYACVASNLYVYVSSNSSTGPVVLTLYKNGSPTTLTVTIPTTTTGIFSDTTHSVSLAAGDIYYIYITANSGGALNGPFGTYSWKLVG